VSEEKLQSFAAGGWEAKIAVVMLDREVDRKGEEEEDESSSPLD